MANYADALRDAMKFKQEQSLKKAEFKSVEPAILKTLLGNKGQLVPAEEESRALGTKTRSEHSVEMHILNQQDIAVGSGFSYNHTGSNNDSTKATLNFSTYSANFSFLAKQEGVTFWNLANQIMAQQESAVNAIHTAIEQDLADWLTTSKSQVATVNNELGDWDATNFIFGIRNADAEYFMQNLYDFMLVNNFNYSGFQTIMSTALANRARRNLTQGEGNAVNLQWQEQGFMAAMSTKIDNETGYNGMGFVMPEGSAAVMPWIPQKNIVGAGDPHMEGGLYTVLPNPVIPELPLAMHITAEAGDYQASGGDYQDVKYQVQVFTTMAPLKSIMSDALASPIYQYGIKS